MWMRFLFAKRERTRFSEQGNWHASFCFKHRPVQLDSSETTQSQLRRKSSVEVDSLWGRVPGKLDLAFKANTVSIWLDLPFFPFSLPPPQVCDIRVFVVLPICWCMFVVLCAHMWVWVHECARVTRRPDIDVENHSLPSLSLGQGLFVGQSQSSVDTG